MVVMSGYSKHLATEVINSMEMLSAIMQIKMHFLRFHHEYFTCGVFNEENK